VEEALMTDNQAGNPNIPIAKRLVRVQKGRKIAGVCTGFGAYFNVDPTLIRLLWILLVIAGGSGILLYFIAWFIMPLDCND
jgi:phage shock protein C